MPIGAFRINTLAKTQAVVVGSDERTAGFVNVSTINNAQLSNAQYKFRTGTRGGSIKFNGFQDSNPGGTADALGLAKIPTWDGSGDMTFEAWVYTNNRDGGQSIFSFRGLDSSLGGSGTYNASDSKSIIIFMDYGGDFKFYVDGGYRQSGSGEPQFSNNTWHHVAVQRSGGVWNAWVDGTRYVDYTSSTDHTATLKDYEQPIGIVGTASPADTWYGYMDEIRISQSARYTNGSSITVPSAAFTPDADTTLLLHGDGPVGSNGNFHIVDDIGDLRPLDIHIQPNAQSGTAPSISTTQSKFGESSLRSYDNDGHAEFATPPFGSAYTIEFWFRANNTSGDQYMAGIWGGSPHGGFTWTIYLNGSTVKTYVWGGTSYAVNNVTIGTASANTWHHVAISWDGSTYRTFLNGTMGGTVSSTTPPNYEKWSTTWIGTVGGTTSNFAGYIDEYRQSNTARYTSSFTPEQDLPFSGDAANTQVLLHFEGTNGSTTTTDDHLRPRSTWINGSWSTTSGQFDTGFQMTSGTTGQVTLPSGYELDDDQTITVEFWFQSSRLGVSNGSTKIFATAPIDDDNYSTASSQITLEVWSDGNLYLNGNQSSETNLGNPGSGTWHHFALQYNGTNDMRVWLNGTHKASKTHSIGAKTDLYWGNRKAGEGSSSGTNKVDEIRISKVNRYTHSTTNFTVPSAKFTNDADTLGLFHCETTDQTDDAS